ncbi:MAG: WG repeat-containing protein, partial [Candidatus Eremiobacteraeota bacterium]|nr:WG repeat-containing protein [Candidatus Eremiobacteraeota bacterium]
FLTTLVQLLLVCLICSGCWFKQSAPITHTPPPAAKEGTESGAPHAYQQTGLVDASGQESLTEKFAYILPLEEEPRLAAVMLSDTKWAFVKPDGEFAFDGRFEQGTGFREGLAVVQQDGKYGFVLPDGTFAVKPEFEFADWAGFHDGLCEVRSGETSAYVDKEGKIVIPYQRELFKAGNFRGGLTHYSKDGEEIFIDTQGKESFRSSLPGPFRYGDDLWVAGEENVTYLDAQGRDVLGKTFAAGRPFRDGLAAAKNEKGWGLIDKTGKFVIEPQYEDAETLTETLFAARKDGKWGVFKTTGEQVVPFEYDEIGYPSGGMVPVKVGTLWGLCDESGKLAVQPKYKSLHPWRDDKHFIFHIEGQ